jgi:hypothetical protein
VGAPFELEAGEPAGAAYIYRRGVGGAWSLEARLTSPTAQPHVRFGAGGALVVGGVFVGEPLESQGVVHVFSEDGGSWTWRQSFRNNSGRGLGGVVAGQSDAAFATRFWPPPYLESVDAYKPDAGWTWDRRRLDSIGACEGVIYGAAIDVHGDVVVVGAPTDPDEATPHPGFAELYRDRPEWNRRERFESPVGAVEADRYGHAVAVDGDRLLVGAPGDVPGPGLVGLAHLTEISEASPAVLVGPSNWNHVEQGDSVVLAIEAAGEEPIAYQWQFRAYWPPEACGYTDVPEDGVYGGTRTAELRITPDWELNTRYTFRCRISNACGTTYSDHATVELLWCIGDWSRDGVRDTRDFLAYINGWHARESNYDLNHDDRVDTADIIAFLNFWVAGC